MVEESWRDVRDELNKVLNHTDMLHNFQDIVPGQEEITNDDLWKSFFFFGLGHRANANCDFCPKTAAILESIPDLVTAYFSILYPGKRIPPHRGPYRGLLRYHLGLHVPEPADAVGINVGGASAHWSEGGSLLFDDGYRHYVWNDTNGIRAVLFIDVIRPVRWPASLVNRAVIQRMSTSPDVRAAKRRHDLREQSATRWGGV